MKTLKIYPKLYDCAEKQAHFQKAMASLDRALAKLEADHAKIPAAQLQRLRANKKTSGRDVVSGISDKEFDYHTAQAGGYYYAR